VIKIENTEVFGWEAAIRGMRNPMNSWDRSDSRWLIGLDDNEEEIPEFDIGENDLKLMRTLGKAGAVHGKYLRMINVTVDITAPLYWWKEFDTYKVGTVANSCSTMHKIHAKEFELDDFSYEHLMGFKDLYETSVVCEPPIELLGRIIATLNVFRKIFIETKDKKYWWQMIQLLPSSYNQKRTVQLNYEVLRGMYEYRKAHKLDEWVEFCKWIETLPYFKEVLLDV
jgi:hypothetical protein